MSVPFFSQAWKELRHPPASTIPGLDALRTLAVLLVIAGHFVEEYVHTLGDTPLKKIPLFYFGWTGVDLFFILSGYLIGRPLLKEIRETGTVQMTSFLLRRGFRIWPLYFFMFALLVIVFNRHQGNINALLPDIFFLSNYLGGTVSGGWSLSTEEQFYIFVPALLLLVKGKIPFGKLWKIPAFLLFFLPVTRFITLKVWLLSGGAYPPPDTVLYSPFHTHSDGLAFGVLVAWMSLAKPDIVSKKSFIQNLPLPICLIVLGIVFRTFNKDIFAFSSLAFIFGGLTLFVLRDQSILTRPLRWNGFHVGSRLSYGMYLNHFEILPFVVHPIAKALAFVTGPGAIPFFLSCGIGILASAGASFITFTLIERPFLLLRERSLPRNASRDNVKEPISPITKSVQPE